MTHLLLLLEVWAGVASHIEQANILAGVAAHAVGVVAHADEQGSEEDGVVKAVPLLLLQHKCGGDEFFRLQ